MTTKPHRPDSPRPDSPAPSRSRPDSPARSGVKTRRCKDCPPFTLAVCRHAFGVYWCVKSGDGEGCHNPLDGVAESWRKAGWTPKDGLTVPVALQHKFDQPDLLTPPPPLSDDDY